MIALVHNRRYLLCQRLFDVKRIWNISVVVWCEIAVSYVVQYRESGVTCCSEWDGRHMLVHGKPGRNKTFGVTAFPTRIFFTKYIISITDALI